MVFDTTSMPQRASMNEEELLQTEEKVEGPHNVSSFQSERRRTTPKRNRWKLKDHTMSTPQGSRLNEEKLTRTEEKAEGPHTVNSSGVQSEWRTTPERRLKDDRTSTTRVQCERKTTSEKREGWRTTHHQLLRGPEWAKNYPGQKRRLKDHTPSTP